MSDHKAHFGAESAEILGREILAVYPDFDLEGYIKEVEVEVEGLELKDRVMKMALGLQKRLPQEYPAAVQILVDSLGDEIETGEGMFTTYWYLMPVARFVEEFGLEHWEASMNALNAITRRHTGEYAVRPYIERHPVQTMALLEQWAQSDNFHVRRLASEGSRPRLPWATQLRQLAKEPQPVFRVLEHLRADPSEYVQKSVGNNLNDIAKDHPELVLDVVERWLAGSPTESTRKIVRRGLRTLEKQNHPRALTLLGYTGGEEIALTAFTLESAEITIGDNLSFTVALVNQSDQAHLLSVNYRIHLVRKNGKHNIKVFKLTTQKIAPNSLLTVTKSQSFKPVSVRRYYPGTHYIDIVVNGIVHEKRAFELLPLDA